MRKVSDYYEGGELIDRLGILAIDLVKAVQRQTVPYPISEIDGEFRTPDRDPGFYDPALCDSPQAWVQQVRAAKFFKPFVQLSMPQIMAELGVCWESEDTPTSPHFASPSELIAYHRGRGVHELQKLARLVDEEFTGKARLTDEALGRLLPANPGAEISDEGHKRQGHRLRKTYQQN